MPRLLEPLWLLILNFSHDQLANSIQYLQEENKILRSKLPKRIEITADEKSGSGKTVRSVAKLGSWMQQVARNVKLDMEDMKLPAKVLIIDHDKKYMKEFDAIFEGSGLVRRSRE